jgi:cbb3-type cytochrome oxidase subunit 3
MTSGVVTAIAMLCFVAIVVWVFIIKRKDDFDEQANLPLDEEDRKKGEEEKTS